MSNESTITTNNCMLNKARGGYPGEMDLSLSEPRGVIQHKRISSESSAEYSSGLDYSFTSAALHISPQLVSWPTIDAVSLDVPVQIPFGAHQRQSSQEGSWSNESYRSCVTNNQSLTGYSQQILPVSTSSKPDAPVCGPSGRPECVGATMQSTCRAENHQHRGPISLKQYEDNCDFMSLLDVVVQQMDIDTLTAESGPIHTSSLCSFTVGTQNVATSVSSHQHHHYSNVANLSRLQNHDLCMCNNNNDCNSPPMTVGEFADCRTLSLDDISYSFPPGRDHAELSLYGAEKVTGMISSLVAAGTEPDCCSGNPCTVNFGGEGRERSAGLQAGSGGCACEKRTPGWVMPDAIPSSDRIYCNVPSTRTEANPLYTQFGELASPRSPVYENIIPPSPLTPHNYRNVPRSGKRVLPSVIPDLIYSIGSRANLRESISPLFSPESFGEACLPHCSCGGSKASSISSSPTSLLPPVTDGHQSVRNTDPPQFKRAPWWRKFVDSWRIKTKQIFQRESVLPDGGGNLENHATTIISFRRPKIYSTNNDGSRAVVGRALPNDLFQSVPSVALDNCKPAVSSYICVNCTCFLDPVNMSSLNNSSRSAWDVYPDSVPVSLSVLNENVHRSNPLDETISHDSVNLKHSGSSTRRQTGNLSNVESGRGPESADDPTVGTSKQQTRNKLNLTIDTHHNSGASTSAGSNAVRTPEGLDTKPNGSGRFYDPVYEFIMNSPTIKRLRNFGFTYPGPDNKAARSKRRIYLAVLIGLICALITVGVGAAVGFNFLIINQKKSQPEPQQQSVTKKTLGMIITALPTQPSFQVTFPPGSSPGGFHGARIVVPGTNSKAIIKTPPDTKGIVSQPEPIGNYPATSTLTGLHPAAVHRIIPIPSHSTPTPNPHANAKLARVVSGSSNSIVTSKKANNKSGSTGSGIPPSGSIGNQSSLVINSIAANYPVNNSDITSNIANLSSPGPSYTTVPYYNTGGKNNSNTEHGVGDRVRGDFDGDNFLVPKNIELGDKEPGLSPPALHLTPQVNNTNPNPGAIIIVASTAKPPGDVLVPTPLTSSSLPPILINSFYNTSDPSPTWLPHYPKDYQCEKNQFRCDSGVSRIPCLYKWERCDGIQDCSDGSDEIFCDIQECNGNFQCDDGRCLSLTKVCDGVAECADDSDEQHCDEFQCKWYEFRCPGGYCIPKEFVCDGESDCPGHFEERNCSQSCNEDQFRCREGWCIPISWRCNGILDCDQGEDEQDCGCSSTQFTCNNGGCSTLTAVCNGIQDCPDGSDEWSCVSLDEENKLFVKFSSNEPLHVCSDDWYEQHSNLICRQLGLSSATGHHFSDFMGAEFSMLGVDKKHLHATIMTTTVQFLLSKISTLECKSRKIVHVSCKTFECGHAPNYFSSAFPPFPAPKSRVRRRRVIGGQVSELHQWPSVGILLHMGEMWACTGTIIAPRWLLTSAQCIKRTSGLESVMEWQLLAGSAQPTPDNPEVVRRSIARFYRHPSHKLQTNIPDFDVMLVELTEPLDLEEPTQQSQGGQVEGQRPKLSAVCLPDQETEPGSWCSTPGWGNIMPGGYYINKVLKHVDMGVIEAEKCNSSDHYPGLITERMLCARNQIYNWGPCFHDEGSPLLCRNPVTKSWFVAGVLSTQNCGSYRQHPAIYADVFKLKTWILNSIGLKSG